MQNTTSIRQAKLKERFTNAALPCQIKTCGMKRKEDIEAVNVAQVDLCGFIIDVPFSKRSISPTVAKTLSSKLSSSIFAIGVFVDAPIETVSQLAHEGIIDGIQLHGNEDDDYLKRLRATCSAPIIQAFRVKNEADINAAYESKADMVLLDSGSGSGNTFNWNIIRTFDRPYLLAGGLTPQNIPTALALLKPWGIDLSSGLETNGQKDKTKIIAAATAVRSNS